MLRSGPRRRELLIFVFLYAPIVSWASGDYTSSSSESPIELQEHQDGIARFYEINPPEEAEKEQPDPVLFEEDGFPMSVILSVSALCVSGILATTAILLEFLRY